jgi:hypothetical protein
MFTFIGDVTWIKRIKTRRDYQKKAWFMDYS